MIKIHCLNICCNNDSDRSMVCSIRVSLGWFGTESNLLVHVCFHSANLKKETQAYLFCIANNKQHHFLAYLLHLQGFILGAAFLKFCVAKRVMHRRQKPAFYANIGKHQLRFLRSFKGMSFFSQSQLSYKI